MSELFKSLLLTFFLAMAISSHQASAQNEIHPPVQSISYCIDAVCGYLAGDACETDFEIRDVAAVCERVYDVRCIDVICAHIGKDNCDELYELSDVADMCRLNES